MHSSLTASSLRRHSTRVKSNRILLGLKRTTLEKTELWTQLSSPSYNFVSFGARNHKTQWGFDHTTVPWTFYKSDKSSSEI
ncbi:unnamed protein product [Allacma fusca]|uniref:Uncharacterized protein n=1 Tax=Allacma fusca TaxID=39272 RepID=A0A8J2LBF0_9HEXA|nr:unnamed protein product [Allacma fusca]